MSIPTLTGLGAFSNAATNYTDPPTALQSVGRTPIPAYVQVMSISPNGITFTNGTNVVAIPIQDAWNLAVTGGDVGLSYKPYFSTQPSPSTVTAPTGTSFTVSTISLELTVSYQWQVSTNGGSSWSNVTNAGVYTGATTVTLNISNSTGLNNNQYRCVATNTLGSTNSSAALLTVH